MNIRLDPISETGLFDNNLYTSDEYKNIYESALRYIKLEGFDEVAGVYSISINGQMWSLKVS